MLAEDWCFLEMKGEGSQGSREGKLIYEILIANAKTAWFSRNLWLILLSKIL
jgi:hypothetical protein